MARKSGPMVVSGSLGRRSRSCFGSQGESHLRLEPITRELSKPDRQHGGI